MVDKFVEVFGKEDNDDDPTNDLIIPIVPNFGNNDILPHNIFTPGPNRWTKKYLSVWRKLIPEEQRHGFERGGWFFVEVIPNKLAVFSINTLYFFDSNTAVDGCADKSEPGYEQMEWLRIQLQFTRQRGMKAILMGHVPPARTEDKKSWDETCWQKYTLWMQQYRDVIVGSLYGHMNIDHFMLQDSREIDNEVMNGDLEIAEKIAPDEELTIQSSADYLSDLRTGWKKIPDSKVVDGLAYSTKKKKGRKSKKSKEQKYFDKIGGVWAERYSMSMVSPSVVPNYYPTMRVFEYNITGIDAMATDQELTGHTNLIDSETPIQVDSHTENFKSGKKHKPKKPNFKVPLPPSKSSLPGPAYSSQAFTWLGYTQYYANLTIINDDFTPDPAPMGFDKPAFADRKDAALDSEFDEQRWHEGKHSGKKPHHKKGHKKFKYEVEYDTRTDPIFNMTELTVRTLLILRVAWVITSL